MCINKELSHFIIFILLLFKFITIDAHYDQESTFLIVGGTPASENSWPWITLLYSRFKVKNKTVSYKCGGSLINDRFILTAAHCFDEYPGEKYINTKVVLGKFNISITEPNEVERLAEKVIIHENYSSKILQNDIALIKMDRVLNFTEMNNNIKPIELPYNKRPSDKENCFAIGWGDIAVNGSSSSVLQQVKLPIMDDLYCKNSRKYFKINTQSMFCAGYDEGGRGTCVGDSGGPLVCHNKDRNWMLYGITSFGGVCAQKGKPPVFTRVSFFKNWIQRNAF